MKQGKEKFRRNTKPGKKATKLKYIGANEKLDKTTFIEIPARQWRVRN
jgi:hypothetical protein